MLIVYIGDKLSYIDLANFMISFDQVFKQKLLKIFCNNYFILFEGSWLKEIMCFRFSFTSDIKVFPIKSRLVEDSKGFLKSLEEKESLITQLTKKSNNLQQDISNLQQSNAEEIQAKQSLGSLIQISIQWGLLMAPEPQVISK